MKRAYYKWHSQYLDREMEMLVFGHSGARVLMFPTRNAHFYDYEDWRIIDWLRPKIEKGLMQVYCVDSIDEESLYCFWAHPSGRMQRNIQYENYIVYEVLPFTRQLNSNMFMTSAGCSLGAYHAVNIALKHPDHFGKAVGMSGRYDLTLATGSFQDLFDGYYDDMIYSNMPSHYIPHVQDGGYLQRLRKMHIILAIGEEDAFLEDNRHLSNCLSEKGISNELHVWEGEAHSGGAWRRMVDWYI